MFPSVAADSFQARAVVGLRFTDQLSSHHHSSSAMHGYASVQISIGLIHVREQCRFKHIRNVLEMS